MKFDDFLLPPAAVEPWEKSARGGYQDPMQLLTMKFSATKLDYGASPGSSFESSGK